MIGQAAASVASFLAGLVPGKAGETSPPGMAPSVPGEPSFDVLLSQATGSGAPISADAAPLPADGDAVATPASTLLPPAAALAPIALALVTPLRPATLENGADTASPAEATQTPLTVHAALAALQAAFQRKPPTASGTGGTDETDQSATDGERAEGEEGNTASPSPPPEADRSTTPAIVMAPSPLMPVTAPHNAARSDAGAGAMVRSHAAIVAPAPPAAALPAPADSPAIIALPAATLPPVQMAPDATALPDAPRAAPVAAQTSPPAAASPVAMTPGQALAGIAWTPVNAPASPSLAALVVGPVPSPAREAVPADPLPVAAKAGAGPIDIAALFPTTPPAPLVVRFAAQARGPTAAGPAAPVLDPLSADAAPATPATASLADTLAMPLATTIATHHAQPGSSPIATAVPVADTQQAALDRQLDLARDSAWLDQLARDISSAADKDGKLRFQLNPEHLGSLDIEVVRNHDGNAIRLSAETEAARQILADAQPRLIAEARAQGMKISETHVDLGGQGSTNGGARGGGEGQQHPQNPAHRNHSLTMNGVRESRADRTTAHRERYA